MDVFCPKCNRYITDYLNGLYMDIHENRFDMECPYCSVFLFIYVEIIPQFHVEEYPK